MPTSASNIIVKNGTKNTVVSADDVNIDGTSVISALSSKQDVLTPGTGIDITNNVISSTVNSAQWGNITGTISNQTDLQTALNAKQDTLVSGSNIKTVNGTSLLGAGDVSIDITPDNLSITKDSNDHLQAVGTVNKNTVASSTNPVYDWVGTLQEYNDQNIETLHPYWICYITDDVQGGTSVYTKNEVNELLDVKANTDLDNLTNTGKNIANWSNNVTNCITEIPQDIKLELKDGTLTLKAGSKVYVPNGKNADGSLKFDVVTIANDVVYNTVTNSTGTSLFFLYPNLSIGAFVAKDDAKANYYFSGPTAPTVTLTYALWYDTANNIVKYTFDNGATWTSDNTLPIAICSYTKGTGVTSIDQIFNGFGYIGSTVFALPGVKGLIPNGRNADGSLKNINVENTNIKTQTFPSNLDLDVVFGVGTSDITVNGLYKYDEQNNYNYDGSTIWPRFYYAIGHLTNGKITSFTPKTAFHALDYNDSSTISGWSMPSSRYIDLTLLASGNTYTAPANGWVVLSTNARSSTTFAFSELGIIDIGIRASSIASSIEWGAMVTIPVKKGQTFWAIYGTAESSYTLFRFIYAEGENV